MKAFLKKVVFGYRSSQEAYVEYLKKCGVKVGSHLEIFNPRQTVIETLNPHLLEIGNCVSMTGPVTILCHDYSVCVLKNWANGEILGKQRKTTIGNNVFLGWGCCVLPGSYIGDNTIIGAYAVVSGKLEPDSVYAGNPAKRICSISEYYEKIKNRQLHDAIIIYKQYLRRNKKKPPVGIFHEYFFLFCGGDYNSLQEEFKMKFSDHGSFEKSISYFEQHSPVFSSYEEFCTFAESKIMEEEI